jgi:ATP-dependent exoDNAse (exonuclease V) beta subunit
MPGDKIAIHPRTGEKIRFTETDHRYTDESGREYTSVTTLVHRAFPEFDAEATAAQTAKKTGRQAKDLIAEWEANRETAARTGTRLHENCENQILGRLERLHSPEDEDEKNRFCQAWGMAESIQARKYDLIQPETIVFSPRFWVAGSVDLWMRKQNNYVIGDWKVVKELRKTAFSAQTGVSFASAHLPDCNYYHYALQLSIYDIIARAEGYCPFTATVAHELYVYDKTANRMRLEPMPNLAAEAALLLGWHFTRELDDVPF